MAMIKLDDVAYSMTPNVAIGYFEKNLKQAKTQVCLAEIQKKLAPVSLVAALFVLGIALLAFLKVKSASRAAMKSRDHLLRAFASTRHLLPLASTGITMALALSIAGLLIYESITIWNADIKDGIRIRLILICGLMALFSLWLIVKSLLAMPGAWKFFKPQPQLLYGQKLSKLDAPGLWQWVEALSAKLNTSPPEYIVGGLNESFFVSSVTYQLKPSDDLLEGKILYLPLAEMSLLSKEETAAIIGHELGHFCGEDTAYTKRFIPIYHGMERSLGTVLKTQQDSNGIDIMLRPAWLLASWSMDKFHEAVMHWSRIREFAADQVSIEIAGQHASCSALVRVVGASKPVNETMRTLRNAPEAMDGNFLKSLRKEAYLHGFGDPEIFLDQVIAHPFDSHPPTRERLARMGAIIPLNHEFREHALRRESPEAEIWLEPMIHNLNGVMTRLTGELGSVMQIEESEFEKQLETIAAAPSGSRIFYERTMMNFLLLGGFGLGCITLGIAIMNLKTTATPEKSKMVGMGIIAFGLLMLWLSRMYIKRGRQSFLELHADGFKVPLVTPLIPWKDVIDLSFTRNQQFLLSEFHLSPEHKIEIKKDPCKRAAYKKKSYTLILNAGRVKGIKTQAYLDLIVEYYNAGRARAIQLARQHEKTAVKERLTQNTPL